MIRFAQNNLQIEVEHRVHDHARHRSGVVLHMTGLAKKPCPDEDSHYRRRSSRLLPSRQPERDDAGDGGDHLRTKPARVGESGDIGWRALQLHELVRGCHRP